MSNQYGENNPYSQPSAPSQYQPNSPYGQPAPGPVSPYGQPYPILPEHPQGTLVLVMGIIGIFTLITGPIALVIGGKARKEIAATGARYSNEQSITIGWVLGIVGTVLLGLTVLMVIGYIIFFVLFFGAMATSMPN